MKKQVILFFVIGCSVIKIFAQQTSNAKFNKLINGINLTEEKLIALEEYVNDEDEINAQEMSKDEKKNELIEVEHSIKNLLSKEEYNKFIENRKKLK